MFETCVVQMSGTSGASYLTRRALRLQINYILLLQHGLASEATCDRKEIHVTVRRSSNIFGTHGFNCRAIGQDLRKSKDAILKPWLKRAGANKMTEAAVSYSSDTS